CRIGKALIVYSLPPSMMLTDFILGACRCFADYLIDTQFFPDCLAAILVDVDLESHCSAFVLAVLDRRSHAGTANVEEPPDRLQDSIVVFGISFNAKLVLGHSRAGAKGKLLVSRLRGA